MSTKINNVFFLVIRFTSVMYRRSTLKIARPKIGRMLGQMQSLPNFSIQLLTLNVRILKILFIYSIHRSNSLISSNIYSTIRVIAHKWFTTLWWVIWCGLKDFFRKKKTNEIFIFPVWTLLKEVENRWKYWKTSVGDPPSAIIKWRYKYIIRS